MGPILKNKEKNKYFYIHAIIRLLTTEMKMKIKKKKNYIDMTYVDLGQDIDTNIVNIKNFSV